MPITYGLGTEYGDSIAFYGRVNSSLLDAQESFARETGLKVTVIDERVNRWEEVVGDRTALKIAEVHNVSGDPNLPTYYSYRTQAKVIKLDNGNVVRVRIGKQTNGVTDPNDRQVYIQTITDLTDVDQWETWTLKYSGTHYAIELVQTGADTYDIYTSKPGVGLCKNNAVAWATASDGADLGNTIFISAVQADWDKEDEDSVPYYRQLNLCVVKPGKDGLRYMDYYYTSDVDSTSPSATLITNYFWTRHLISTLLMDDGNFLIIETMPITDPRSPNRTDSITCRIQSSPRPSISNPPLVIRGFGGDYGHNTISGARVFKFSDGYYYIFYRESHVDDAWQAISNTDLFVWQRSKDGLHWSEPVHCGFQPNERAGAFEATVDGEDWVYYCGNGDVHRRPATSKSYSIENYVPSLSWDSPRDNQEGSGSVTVANPAKVNDFLLDLSDRRIKIEPGIKAGDSFEFVQLEDNWIKSVVQESEGAKSRINIALGNVWSRLGTPLRDTVNIIGKTNYHDWDEGLPNQPFNYFFDSGEPTIVGNSLKVSEGGALWTGWKGINPEFDFHFSTWNIEFYIRYVDENNYIKVSYTEPSAGLITITQVKDNVSSTLDTASTSKLSTAFGGFTKHFFVRIRWNFLELWVTHPSLGKIGLGEFTLNDGDTDYLLSPGYVGWNSDSEYTISKFNFTDFEVPISSGDLIKTALAMGDYHDVIVPEGSQQYNLIWGPQTDLQTPAQALQNILEAEKLELVWRDNQIQVGQFKGVAPVKTITDRIIKTDYVDEASRRVNLVTVDGNDSSWIEVDSEDSQDRDRQIVAYYDLPELKTADEVKARAAEELRRSTLGQSPGGEVPLFFDLWRMDPIVWVDNQGRSYNVRIEGISVDINQSDEPHQRETLDTSIL